MRGMGDRDTPEGSGCAPDGASWSALTRWSLPGEAHEAHKACASLGTMAPRSTAASMSAQPRRTRTDGKNTSSAWVISHCVGSSLGMVSGCSLCMLCVPRGVSSTPQRRYRIAPPPSLCAMTIQPAPQTVGTEPPPFGLSRPPFGLSLSKPSPARGRALRQAQGERVGMFGQNPNSVGDINRMP